jgi:hypothetical protein
VAPDFPSRTLVTCTGLLSITSHPGEPMTCCWLDDDRSNQINISSKLAHRRLSIFTSVPFRCSESAVGVLVARSSRQMSSPGTLHMIVHKGDGTVCTKTTGMLHARRVKSCRDSVCSAGNFALVPGLFCFQCAGLQETASATSHLHASYLNSPGANAPPKP